MATIEDMAQALKNAHAAGDTNAAQKIADAIVKMRSASAPESNPAIDNLEYGQVPEGIVMDEKTGRMVDTKALGQSVTGLGAATSMMRGIPFIGTSFDEVVGGGDPVKTEAARQAGKQYEADHPYLSTAGQLAAGATAIPAAVMAGGLLPNATSMAGKIIGGLFGGAAGGLVEGGSSGYFDGEGDGRGESAGQGAVRGAIGGLVAGAAAPVIAKGFEYATGKVGNYLTTNRLAREAGLNPDAAKVVNEAVQADLASGAPIAQRIADAGDNGMLADTGSATQGLLDLSIQKGGKGSNLATAAVQKRAADAATKLRGTMDLTLGQPPGINQAAREISEKTAKQREFLYKYAHSSPIDYASDAGRKVEDVFARTPPSILRSAINEANDAMRVAGEKNMQILADIADDGTVTFKQMPNMRQVDELKKAFGAVGAKEVDQFGRPTAAGLRANRLARELRDAAVEAVPVYGKAIKLGGDKIAEDRALQLGYSLLSPSVTREAVRDAAEGITDAERKQLAIGLRQHIDDTMANVTKAISDPNLDAREAAKVWKDMSSKAAREKVTEAIGEKRANALFSELDRTGTALGLKAAVANNTKTFARQNADRQVKGILEPGPIGALMEGKPLNAWQRSVQAFTGRTPEDMLNRERALFSDVSDMLVGHQGQGAIDLANRLQQIYQQQPVVDAMAKNVGFVAGATALGPAYNGVKGILSGLLEGSERQ